MAMAMSSAFSVSSFGAENTTMGPMGTFRGRAILDSERRRDLDRRQSYYDCTQHDYKRFDFDGRVIQNTGAGSSVTQPLISSERAAWYIPLRARRPSSPYRLPRVVVNAFTNLIFGEDRFPLIRIQGADDAQDYTQALARAASLPAKMIRARNLGGATGTGVLSWAYVNGKPRVEVHNAKNMYVHSWEDRELLIPKHCTECYLYPEDVWDSSKKRYVRKLFWYRRDWTPNADILFNTVEFKNGEDPVDAWRPDFDRSVEHKDGLTHVVWIQNIPSEEIDGLPDYEGLYESFDSMDLVLSVITRGATLNLDPTLKLKVDPDLINRMGIKKGSDNALVVGPDGDAEYLELQGTSIEAGLKLFEAKRRAALEVAQCIIPDPNEVAGQGVSSVALKVIYAPMLGKCDMLREQYGSGMKRLLDDMLAVARLAPTKLITIYHENGQKEEVPAEVKLPPRIVMDQPPAGGSDSSSAGSASTDSSSNDNGAAKAPAKPKPRIIQRTPGSADDGGELEMVWGPYFSPTPDDQQKTVTTLSLAVGQQPFMSTQTAVEIAMASYGRTPDEEWGRVQKQQQDIESKQKEMFSDADGGAGGRVAATHELPGGAGMKVHRTMNIPGDDDGKDAPPGGGKPPGAGGPPKGPPGK
jgi:hypothetical protein